MFSFILLWALQTVPGNQTNKPLAKTPGDSITIFGTCWDISTGVDLQARTYAVVKGEKLSIGKSNENGKFDLQIPTTTESLIFEMEGYRSVSRPVNMLGKPQKGDRFPISIRMISLDSQRVVKLQPEITTRKSSNTSEREAKSKRTYFEVKDAYSTNPVKAKICILNTKTTEKQCFETDTSRLPTPVYIQNEGRTSVHITADGFEDYVGDFGIDNTHPGDMLYHIKLLRVQNPVSMCLDAPDSLDLRYILGRNDRSGMELGSERLKHRKYINLDVINTHVNFLGTHQILVITGKQAYLSEGTMTETINKAKSNGNVVLLNDSVTASAGLNFWSIHVNGPSPEMVADALQPGNYTTSPFNKRTLYFDQSSYLLRNNTKLTLDSISEFLLKQRNAKAQLTGHTDNVGRRDRNMMLSEYRARVVAHYLQKNGVPDRQIVYNWKGPDTPVAVNDTEANKVKNRRVDVRVLEN